MRALVLLVLVAVVVVAESLGGCLDTKDCGPGECCVAGTQRYSPPSCQLRRLLNENCRPNNTAYDGGFTYPNGESISYTNVYYVVCPCEDGLTCDQGYCVNQSP